ncbi:MAG: hypothetical protein VX294_10740 [Candidatus Latescibacterota bacterium]|nr:hypothetical protein [Candidatus Latescibacterota bacterium]
MIGWQSFWTCILAISVFLFFLVEVVVVIGGIGDIRSMMRSLRRQADNPSSNEES